MAHFPDLEQATSIFEHVKSSAIYTPNAYEVICRVARMAEWLRLPTLATVVFFVFHFYKYFLKSDTINH
jgi:hypothetical protein